MPDVPRILIVEDDAPTAYMLSNLMQEIGYEVCGLASTAPRAVALADYHRPDLVLLDLGLGRGTDGIAAAWEMRHRLKLDVLIVSGSDPDSVEDPDTTRNLPWVRKPFTAQDIRLAVGRALAGKSAHGVTRATERPVETPRSRIRIGMPMGAVPA